MRTKGKDERGVGYVKHNAIAGRRFENWAAFEAHLDRWTREIADQRVHGTTGVAPAERFAEEAMALRPLGGRAPFGQLRDLVRKVQADCAIPGHEQLLGSLAADRGERPGRGAGRSRYRASCWRGGGGSCLVPGRRQRIVERAHLAGVVGAAAPVRSAPVDIVAPSALLRPLAEYEALVGGSW